MLSITTDYAQDWGDPRPYLARIAAAGFTHVHWCHHWSTDFLYSRAEVAAIRRWLSELGLAVLDIHASAGREKGWDSPQEHERLAGVELVSNRLEMAAELGADVIVLHASATRPLASQRRSLEALEPVARRLGLRIALENLPREGFARIDDLFASFPPELIGLCYDCGHGNIGCDATADLVRAGSRLAALHLHDNDGTGDLHRIPFTGSVSWPKVMSAIAGSAYRKCVSLEISVKHHTFGSEAEFLAAARLAAERLATMLTAGAAR
jgi:sugar phosphate isomerase/epimerase